MSLDKNRTSVYGMPNQPELEHLIEVSMRQLALKLSSHSIARIAASTTHPTGYNPVTSTVSVVVESLQVIVDHFTPATPLVPNPVKIQTPVLLDNIKISIPRAAAGTAWMTLPWAIGDTGTLHVQDRSIDQWRLKGIPTDPVSMFVHFLADSVFHPDIAPDTVPLTPPPNPVAAVIEAPLIMWGALASEPVLKGATVASAFSTYTAAVAAAGVTHAGLPTSAVANKAFITSLVAATATLATSIPNWPSVKVLTE